MVVVSVLSISHSHAENNKFMVTNKVHILIVLKQFITFYKYVYIKFIELEVLLHQVIILNLLALKTVKIVFFLIFTHVCVRDVSVIKSSW